MAAEIELHHLTLRSEGESTSTRDRLELAVARTVRERLFRHFRSTLCSNDQPDEAVAKPLAA